MRRRLLPVVAVTLAVLVSVLVSGCSGDEEEKDAREPDLAAYCALTEDISQRVQKKLNNFEDPTPLLQEAQHVAPDEVAADWNALIEGYQAYIRAITEDLLDVNDPPDGLSADDVALKNAEVLAEVTEEHVTPTEDDAERIRQHAKAAC